MAALEQAILPVAIENGFEVVMADLAQPLITSTERDKRGVARVLEALQTVMWSSLDAGRARRGPPRPAADKEAADGETGAAAAAKPAVDGVRYEPPPMESGEPGMERGALAAEALEGILHGVEERAGGNDTAAVAAGVAGDGGDAADAAAAPGGATESAAPGLTAPSEPISGLGSHVGDEDADALGMGDLEALMQEAVKLKLAGSAMSREERHERAADVALKLAIAMGIDQDDDVMAMLSGGAAPGSA